MSLRHTQVQKLRPRVKRSRRSSRTGVLFVAPTLVYFTVWVFAPIAYGLWLSLTDASFGAPTTFVGVKNFSDLAHDQAFISSVIVTAKYLVEVVVPTMVLAFAGAYLIRACKDRLANFYVAVLFLPFVLPAVAAAIVFELILQPYGILNQTLHISVAWLSNPDDALYGLSAVTAWGLTGYYVVIFLAGLTAVPQEVLEAASIDGASRLRTLWSIELPLLKPTILFATVTVVAAVLTNFATPYVMTQGGPGNSTMVLPLLIYTTAFQYSNAGYAAAMAFVLFVATTILTALQFLALRGRR